MSIFRLLEKDHKKTYQNIDRFSESVKRLRFEGKQSTGKNIKKVRELVSYFSGELDGHMREEEKILFPFLKAHIPRLEPMICLLISEHEDFRNTLKDLKRSLAKLSGPGPDKSKSAMIYQIDEQGSYLACLLRSHMRIETKSIYQAADKELHASEKKDLVRLIVKNVYAGGL